MVVTTYGEEQLAIRLGSNTPFVQYVALGSGSGLTNATNVRLVAETDRNAFTSTDFTTAQQFTFDADYNSVEMSGTLLKEFGVFPSGPATTGSLWQREGLSSVTFDGSNELKIEITWEIF